jgi:hypothetical protein
MHIKNVPRTNKQAPTGNKIVEPFTVLLENASV